MDHLNDTWLHSNKNKNLRKIQCSEQTGTQFIMVSRCAINTTVPGLSENALSQRLVYRNNYRDSILIYCTQHMDLVCCGS